MLSFLAFLAKILLSLIKSKKSLLIQNAYYKKEIEILKRQTQNKRRNINRSDRIIFTILNIIGNIKDSISIVKPETILKWQRMFIKSIWTFKKNNKKPGRPPVPYEIKLLILRIKNENLFWGVKKIQGELLKLNIELDSKTIWNILRVFRRKGKIKRSLTWKRFLGMQIDSIFAMDFFTVDTITKHTFYIFFIIHHSTRQIIQFAITLNPTIIFVKQQIVKFEEMVVQKAKHTIYMIYDNGSHFYFDLSDYGITPIRTAIK